MLDLTPPRRLTEIELFAWLGEDDGPDRTGVIGLKQGLVPAGFIPLVATDVSKINRAHLMTAMGIHALESGMRRYLCRYKFDGLLWHTPTGEPPS